MFDEAPEHRSFKFRSGFVVNRHEHDLNRCLAVLCGGIDIK
jgi:hypothetical protein